MQWVGGVGCKCIYDYVSSKKNQSYFSWPPASPQVHACNNERVNQDIPRTTCIPP